MKKLNIAEILKDCPKGMELDCTMYENVEFDHIEQSPESKYPIHCLMKTNDGYNTMVFTNNGCNDRHPNAKCVIFPKGKTTWEGFQRPFKDGDILSNDICICIYNGNENENHYGLYVGVGHIDYPDYFIIGTQNSYFTKENAHLATEEEKQKLFDAIKANGYRWNDETKTLEKLIEPKFKVGDKIKSKISQVVYTITGIRSDVYIAYVDMGKFGYHIPFSEEKNYELVPNKFDITTLKPFESKVLVRNFGAWEPAFWGYYSKEYIFPFVVVGGNTFNKCIPYKGNEHLLGTSDDCDDYYKTWE